ncbi:hypothetical protein A5662_02200 [Mycobacteriaceae bacterium 1482268.1]|nr:hypothetical protein A5662_02200 [Mycobacteriaceae bacterium 1482268.1]
MLRRRTTERSASLSKIEDVIEFGKNSIKPVRIFEIRAERECEEGVAVAASVYPTRQGKGTVAEFIPRSAVIFFGSKRHPTEKAGRVLTGFRMLHHPDAFPQSLRLVAKLLEAVRAAHPNVMRYPAACAVNT